MNSFYKALVVIALFVNQNVRSQGDCDGCYIQFSSNCNFITWRYVESMAWECTPVFGSENHAGWSVLYGAIFNGLVEEGLGTIVHGIDMTEDYWNCLDRLQEQYYSALDSLSWSLDACLRQQYNCGYLLNDKY